MNSRLIALKLFLDELEVPADISSMSKRKRIQKSVYLGQLSGADLSYPFSWYLKGPYSTQLTRDYFALSEEINSGNQTWEGKRLRKPIRDRLAEIRPLLEKPDLVSLSVEDWLELVASLHFIEQVQLKTVSQAADVIKNKKPQLAAFVGEAQERVKEILETSAA